MANVTWSALMGHAGCGPCGSLNCELKVGDPAPLRRFISAAPLRLQLSSGASKSVAFVTDGSHLSRNAHQWLDSWWRTCLFVLSNQVKSVIPVL